MKKVSISLLYLFLNPSRTVEIINLYKFLKGRYKIKIILSHAYKEAFYRKKHPARNNNRNVISSIDKNNSGKQQIIINIHDGLLHSGGLTDRLKGICALYMYAKKENFKFKIYFVAPFNLEKYLLPNHYDWTIDENLISYDLNTAAIYTWETEKMAGQFFSLNKSKKQLHIGCNSGEFSENYSQLFHELFKPSPFLTSKLNFHTKNLGGDGNYISISLRFQNLLGEFEEGDSSSLNKDDRKILINKCLMAINEIKEQFLNTEKILITSDSNIFREITTKTYNYIYTYILHEETGHIDYAAPGKGKELTAFLDMFLISKAKKAYQIRSDEMYNSDFPKRAAKINNIPYEMVLIE